MFQHFPFFMCIHAIPVLYFIGRLYLEVILIFFPFTLFFGLARPFRRFSPVVSAAVPDVFGFSDQFNFDVPAVELKQMTVMFPFAHAAYLHVVDHVPGDPGFGRHRF